MSFLSLSSAAGPSTTTLQALSDYCSSSDSPDLSFAPDDSDSYFIISHDTPSLVSATKLVPELPQILLHSSRFRSASVQKRIEKALKPSTGSGFTRQAPSAPVSATKDRSVSIQGICEGRTGSNDRRRVVYEAPFVNDGLPIPIGLGLLMPSTSGGFTRYPAEDRDHEYQHIPIESAEDVLTSRLLLSPSFAPSPETNSSPRQSVQVVGSLTSYAALGRGFPSHMRSARLASGITIASTRAVSQVLNLVPSGSFTLLDGLPSLQRCPRVPSGVQSTSILDHIRLQAANMIRSTKRTRLPDGISTVLKSQPEKTLSGFAFFSRGRRDAQVPDTMSERIGAAVGRFGLSWKL
ncbi:hypothetical protein C8J57DRAFT_1299641 [Mycena rebaudengoi]|nr:hypothetical protein C8J57DRAFT_1299641 [Mycena rebaudengoi]